MKIEAASVDLPELSSRLMTIASMVIPGSQRIIDIGTDHAYLPIWLVGKGVCNNAEASDLRSGPARRAKENITRYGLENEIKVSIGDGLSRINPVSSDTIIIAGMGGLEIIRILSVSLPLSIRLLLQPQKSVPELRIWLISNGFIIEDEKIVKDRGHFYTVLSVLYQGIKSVGTNNSIDMVAAWIGPVLGKKHKEGQDIPYWCEYLAEKKRTLSKAVRGRPDLKPVLNEIIDIFRSCQSAEIEIADKSDKKLNQSEEE